MHTIFRAFCLVSVAAASWSKQRSVVRDDSDRKGGLSSTYHNDDKPGAAGSEDVRDVHALTKLQEVAPAGVAATTPTADLNSVSNHSTKPRNNTDSLASLVENESQRPKWVGGNAHEAKEPYDVEGGVDQFLQGVPPPQKKDVGKDMPEVGALKNAMAEEYGGFVKGDVVFSELVGYSLDLAQTAQVMRGQMDFHEKAQVDLNAKATELKGKYKEQFADPIASGFEQFTGFTKELAAKLAGPTRTEEADLSKDPWQGKLQDPLGGGP